jgi:hypothetical protein
MLGQQSPQFLVLCLNDRVNAIIAADGSANVDLPQVRAQVNLQVMRNIFGKGSDLYLRGPVPGLDLNGFSTLRA